LGPGAHPAGSQRRENENDEYDGGEGQRLHPDGQPEWGDRRIEVETDHIQHGPQCTGRRSSESCGPACPHVGTIAARADRRLGCRLADTHRVGQALRIADPGMA